MDRGVPGAFLSVPIMSVIKILCLNMDNGTAQWFARLLEGNVERVRPPCCEPPTRLDAKRSPASSCRQEGAAQPHDFYDYGSYRPGSGVRKMRAPICAAPHRLRGVSGGQDDGGDAYASMGDETL